MSVTLYDDAILKKFKEIYTNTVFSDSEEAFKRSAEINEGKVILPLFCISRPSYAVNSTLKNDPAVRRVLKPMQYNDDGSEIRGLYSLPLRIEYLLEIFASKKETANKITGELLFWINRHPEINVIEPKTGKYFTCNITLEDEVTDNTDPMSFSDRGRIYRNTLNMRIEDARLFAIGDIKTVLYSSVEVFIEDYEDIFENEEGKDEQDD